MQKGSLKILYKKGRITGAFGKRKKKKRKQIPYIQLYALIIFNFSKFMA
jgi:hypothetical protein